MGSRVNLGGLVIAGVGFFLTRFTVTLAIYDSPIRFYFAGVIPLLLGLGLAAFGMALAVADVEAATARTTAVWCVIGLGTMLILVILTLMGSTRGSLPDLATVRSQAYLSNFLIGGSVGGALTGLYAARNRRHRGEIERHANRLQVLNRLLRHEVLNAVAVIQGWSSVDGGGAGRGQRAIQSKAESIERTIEEVSELTRATGSETSTTTTVDLRSALDRSVETVTAAHPETDIAIEGCPLRLPVRATAQVERVFTHLLENAIAHAGERTPTLEVSTTDTDARITVRDHGPGLPPNQQALLETGEIEEFDDPDTGFGLNVSRLLVEDSNGWIETDVGPDGTAITVVLSRARVASVSGPLPTGMADVRPALPDLLVTLGSAVLAGVAYGITSELLGGSIAGIGVFYGAASPVVGWLTHEFHSVVFSFVYAGLVSMAPTRHHNRPIAHVVIALGWALVLWVVAAGVIAPIWLQLLGIPATIPHLSASLFVSHVAWAITLGLLTAVGYEHLSPRVSGLGELIRKRSIGI